MIPIHPGALPAGLQKLLRQLHHKKFRREYKMFIAEGEKLVTELLHSKKMSVKKLIAVKEFYVSHQHKIAPDVECYQAGKREMERISGLASASPVLACVEIPENPPDIRRMKKGITLVLDDIRDPGNLGTMVRIADWFGISHIVCSPSTVDVYNPKVVQATMGSIARVSIFYRDLKAFFGEVRTQAGPGVIGAVMNGNNVYATSLPENAFLLIGNESHGISKELIPFLNFPVTIPCFNTGSDHPESLNAAVAMAILCSELKRKITV